MTLQVLNIKKHYKHKIQTLRCLASDLLFASFIVVVATFLALFQATQPTHMYNRLPAIVITIKGINTARNI